MKNLVSILILFIIVGCNSKIKNEEPQVIVEEGTEVIDTIKEQDEQTVQHKSIVNEPNIIPVEELLLNQELQKNQDTLGFWVGFFEQSKSASNYQQFYVDEGFYWNRANKINISIDKIKGDSVYGHSIVAGNYRPFTGVIQDSLIIAKEPGDDKYDGVFNFKIENNKLIGTWKANKEIEITERQYSLEKKFYTYDADIMLERKREYLDWNKFIEEKEEFEVEEGVFEEWITQEFSTATDLIYDINASNTLLKKEVVENLKKGDLKIIRNTIYARHGYSFKTRPLRVFFDAQEWYIPLHTDVRSQLTDIEKANIQLLLRYEENAEEYYDYFGRG